MSSMHRPERTAFKSNTKNNHMDRLLRLMLRTRLKLRSKPLRYLFILCPMRSGSSLLGHILTSNPAIAGYGEHHYSYKKETALLKMVHRTTEMVDNLNLRKTQYVMDKIVWNYPISKDILRRDDTHFIFLMRNPIDQFRSVVKLSKTSDWHKEWLKNEENWVNYFRERMNLLANTAHSVNDIDRCLLLSYEDLLGNTGDTLVSLHKFLKTEKPFSENYSLRKSTGDIWRGDSSDTLKSGAIQRNKKLSSNLSLPSKFEKEIHCIHDGTLSLLQKACECACSFIPVGLLLLLFDFEELLSL